MKGLWSALGAYAMWGCFPLFFYLLSPVAPLEVLASRIIFAGLFASLLVVILKQTPVLKRQFREWRPVLWSGAAALLISLNWYVFIWSVANARVQETSLGYFMTPLVSLLIGALLLKEKVNAWQLAAGGLAAIAIGQEWLSLGGLPWVSLVLAISFGLYGLVRKMAPMDSLVGLTLETLWVMPLAIVYLVFATKLTLGSDAQLTGLLVLSGVVTAIPLLLFARSVRALNLVVAGFVMYLNPLMQFMTAVWILDETVPSARYITFVLVWIAMFLFSWGLWQAHRVRHPSSVEPQSL